MSECIRERARTKHSENDPSYEDEQTDQEAEIKKRGLTIRFLFHLYVELGTTTVLSENPETVQYFLFLSGAVRISVAGIGDPDHERKRFRKRHPPETFGTPDSTFANPAGGWAARRAPLRLRSRQAHVAPYGNRRFRFPFTIRQSRLTIPFTAESGEALASAWALVSF